MLNKRRNCVLISGGFEGSKHSKIRDDSLSGGLYKISNQGFQCFDNGHPASKNICEIQMKNQANFCSEQTRDWETIDPCNGENGSRFIKAKLKTQNCSAGAKCEGYLEKTLNHSALILYDVKTNNRTVAESACKELNSELYTGYELVGIGNWNESLFPTEVFTAFWTGFLFDWDSKNASVPGKNIWFPIGCEATIWSASEPNGKNGEEELIFINRKGQLFDALANGDLSAIVVCDKWELDVNRSTPCN